MSTSIVINIPNDSEASDATIISGFHVDEEQDIQSPKVQQPQQQPDINPMARTRKKQAAVELDRELRCPNETQLGEESTPPPPPSQQRKSKAPPL